VAAVILGDDELAKGVATVRDLQSGAQEQVPLAQLQDRLAAYRQ
jgi:histidyl-tRNA synthetase